MQSIDVVEYTFQCPMGNYTKEQLKGVIGLLEAVLVDSTVLLTRMRMRMRMKTQLRMLVAACNKEKYIHTYVCIYANNRRNMHVCVCVV